MLRSISQKEYINEIKQWYEDKPNDTLQKLLNNRHGIFYRFLDKDAFNYDDEDEYDFDAPCPCCGSEQEPTNFSVKQMFEDNLQNILNTINTTNTNESIENTGTPLHWVAWQYSNMPGCLEIANALIQCGANVNAINKFGQTPLSKLCDNASNRNKFNDMDLVNVLMSAGADINLGNALYEAADRDHTELVEYLISKGADVNQTDNKGNTPLSKAIKNPKNYSKAYMDKYNANAIALIDAGTDLTLPNEYGRAAYNLAKINKNMTIVDYIDSIKEKHTFVKWLNVVSKIKN
jgi:ankyrin repeat protein